MQQRFGLHDLAIEDALLAHQRPKLEIYGDSIFIALRTAQLVDHKIQFGETHIFAGRGYVVTVRHGSTTAYREVRARCEGVPKMLAKGESFVVYSIIDFIVDNYFPVLHDMEAEADALEEEVFAHRSDLSGGADDVTEIHLVQQREALLVQLRLIAHELDVSASVPERHELQLAHVPLEDHAPCDGDDLLLPAIRRKRPEAFPDRRGGRRFVNAEGFPEVDRERLGAEALEGLPPGEQYLLFSGERSPAPPCSAIHVLPVDQSEAFEREERLAALVLIVSQWGITTGANPPVA